MDFIEYPTTDYNSWISDDGADEYFENRLNADPQNAASNKEAALITAFNSINELDLDISFTDDGTLSDNYSDSEKDTILSALRLALTEQALHELVHDLDSPNISGLSLGDLLSAKIPQPTKSDPAPSIL